MEPWIVFLLDSSLHRKPGSSTGTWKRDPKHRPCRFLSMLVPQADKQMTGGWGPLSLNWSQSINCRPKSPTKKRQSCKRHMLGFTAANWEFLPRLGQRSWERHPWNHMKSHDMHFTVVGTSFKRRRFQEGILATSMVFFWSDFNQFHHFIIIWAWLKIWHPYLNPFENHHYPYFDGIFHFETNLHIKYQAMLSHFYPFTIYYSIIIPLLFHYHSTVRLLFRYSIISGNCHNIIVAFSSFWFEGGAAATHCGGGLCRFSLHGTAYLHTYII